MSAPRRALRAAHASRATASPTSPTRRSRRRRAGRWTRRAAWDARTGSSVISRLVTDPKDGQEGLLRDLDRSHHLHALLALLLLLEELPLAGDVTAVALREHVLALRLHGLARDDLPADRGLNAHVEHLLRDEPAELVYEHSAGLWRALAVRDDREGVDDGARDEDVEAHEIRCAVLDRRRRGDEVEVVLALEALLHDLEMEKAEETRAKAEAERLGGLGLVDQRSVVQSQLLHRVLQQRVVLRVRGIETREHHRLR